MVLGIGDIVYIKPGDVVYSYVKEKFIDNKKPLSEKVVFRPVIVDTVYNVNNVVTEIMGSLFKSDILTLGFYGYDKVCDKYRSMAQSQKRFLYSIIKGSFKVEQGNYVIDDIDTDLFGRKYALFKKVIYGQKDEGDDKILIYVDNMRDMGIKHVGNIEDKIEI